MPDRPTFDYEQQYWREGIQLVAGIDEAGMGALAGPVTAAAVILDRPNPKIEIQMTTIRDSKQMTEKQREEAADLIKQSALAWAIGEAGVADIFELNIRRASHLAMRRAVEGLPVQPKLLLIDGLPSQPHPLVPAVNLIGGDSSSYSIAAASILAKVHRDAIMRQLAKLHPEYVWESNKGYGSKVHLEALSTHGATEHHRAEYAPVAEVLNKDG